MNSNLAAPKRILVVDDESSIRLLYVDMLFEHGYKIDTAADGDAAWMAIQSASYDLIITDNIMPRMSGVELIKSIHDARLSLPIILVTGTLPGREIIQEPWFQGVVLLLKPISIRQLLLTVTTALSPPRVHGA